MQCVIKSKLLLLYLSEWFDILGNMCICFLSDQERRLICRLKAGETAWLQSGNISRTNSKPALIRLYNGDFMFKLPMNRKSKNGNLWL